MTAWPFTTGLSRSQSKMKTNNSRTFFDVNGKAMGSAELLPARCYTPDLSRLEVLCTVNSLVVWSAPARPRQ